MTETMMAGVELMIVGMGIVYLFLGMLIVMVNMMSAVITRYFPQAPQELSKASSTQDANVVAAIMAAVHQYRSKHK